MTTKIVLKQNSSIKNESEGNLPKRIGCDNTPVIKPKKKTGKKLQKQYDQDVESKLSDQFMSTKLDNIAIYMRATRASNKKTELLAIL